ncbi:hypothetical protein DY000_02031091 [Brassica cretica]|uniref:Uncharacterized protein n=1 Tax=Brassica cretica TaxID=69181 RepID=A0ABQ7DWX2_BRACR|nr:hypothetical protein DY000_02031091 [Brassica cretica]
MCKGFDSTLTGPPLQWYINLPFRSIVYFAILSDNYIARFNQEKVTIPKCSIPTAISAFKRGLLPDRELYKELTKYQCKTMEDILSRAWAHVKMGRRCRQSRQGEAKARPQGDQTRPNRARSETLSKTSQGFREQKPGHIPEPEIEKAEGMAVSTWPDISHLYVSKLVDFPFRNVQKRAFSFSVGIRFSFSPLIPYVRDSSGYLETSLFPFLIPRKRE